MLLIPISGNLVIKRWKNVRDNWLKWKKRERESKRSGAGACKIRKYLYHDQLKFLERTLMHRTTVSNVGIEGGEEHTYEGESQQEDSQSAAVEICENPHEEVQTMQTAPEASTPLKDVKTSKARKKRTLDEFEEKILQAIQVDEQEDRHMMFFKGIIPSLRMLRESQIVDFQIGVLQLLKNIQMTPPTPPVQRPLVQPQQQLPFPPPRASITNPEHYGHPPSHFSQPFPSTAFQSPYQHHTPSTSQNIPLITSHLSTPTISNPHYQQASSTSTYQPGTFQPISSPTDTASLDSEHTQSSSAFTEYSDIDI